MPDDVSSTVHVYGISLIINKRKNFLVFERAISWCKTCDGCSTSWKKQLKPKCKRAVLSEVSDMILKFIALKLKQKRDTVFEVHVQPHAWPNVKM